MEIILLGSSGSIGLQTLDVARRHKIGIKGLAVKSNVRTLELQVREFNPQYACVYDENCYTDLKSRLADTKVEVLCGKEGMKRLAAINCDMMVNAVVGMSGFEPTLAAIEAGNKIALANKETLAAGGELVMKRAKEKKVEIIPIDSEHSAIFQCLAGNNKKDVSKIILTASGGAFYGCSRDELRTVTKLQALHNPNWNMGAKVTVDSATLFNKGLECIEACHLFGLGVDELGVVIHRQSIVHSMVELVDGAVLAQCGDPNISQTRRPSGKTARLNGPGGAHLRRTRPQDLPLP
jgi:1-deoxy-D-xylulose-5-phosphate reductoisomerase